MNPMLRLDAAVARAIVAIRGGKQEDHMPWPREDEPEATPQMALQLLKAAMKPKPKPQEKVKKNG